MKIREGAWQTYGVVKGQRSYSAGVYYVDVYVDITYFTNTYKNFYATTANSEYYTGPIRVTHTNPPPSVSSVSPTTATFNQQTTFSVYGSNLPSGMGFYIDECANVAELSGTSTRRQFRCTPSYSPGNKSGIVKTTSGGTTLYNFTVNVVESTPSTPGRPSASATGPTRVSTSWSSVSGASLYTLWRSTSSGSYGSQIACTSSTSYTDSGSHLSPSTTYYYRVRAGNSSASCYNSSTGWSGYSSYRSVTTQASPPSVSSVSPTTATLNQQTTFSVYGSNLPSGMGFYIDECANVAELSGTSTRRQFRCTPSYSAGQKNGVVKDSPNGSQLFSFTVNVSNPAPVVSSVAPLTAVLNEQTVFTINGSNLTSGMGFYIDECANVTELSGSSTSRQFRCTPSYSAGQKSGVVKDSPNGSQLFSFSVNVSTPAPVVSSVAPLAAVLNEQTVFTINGSDLRSGMGFYIDECANVTELSGSSTSRQFRCTPSYTAGQKDGVVKDGPNGALLFSFSVNVSNPDPVVTSVAPLSAVLNEQTVYTINGSNLPSGMGFYIDECANVTELSGSSTSRQFRCTPSYSAGQKSGVVKDSPNGSLLFPFTVNVSNSAAVVTSIAPRSAALDQQTVFTINGSNLTSGMGFWIDECANASEVSGGGSSMRQFRCTPSYSTGQKDGVIKDSPNGTELYSFTVNVSDTGPVVTSLAPLSAVLNEQTVFTINGSNLYPGMAFWIDECANVSEVPGGSSTMQQFQCTPSYSVGQKEGVVKNSQNGIELYSFTVNVSNSGPVVTSLAPLSAVLNEQTVFTISGSNLPSGMGFWIDQCANVTEVSGGDSTMRQFRCTPSYSTGQKDGVVKDSPDGLLLYTFSVAVSGRPEVPTSCIGHNYEQQMPVAGVETPSVTINGAASVEEGGTISLTANATVDTQNGATAFFYWCADRGGFISDPNSPDNSTVTYIAPLVAGVDENVVITVQVGDALGYVDTDAVTILVTEANNDNPGDPAPIATIATPGNIVVGEPYTISFTVSDQDESGVDATDSLTTDLYYFIDGQEVEIIKGLRGDVRSHVWAPHEASSNVYLQIVTTDGNSTTSSPSGIFSVNQAYMVEGYVTDQNGAPIENASIQIPGVASVYSDYAGYYQIRGLSAGSYSVSTFKAGFDFEPDSLLVILSGDAPVAQANFMEKFVPPDVELAVSVSGNGIVTSTPSGVNCPGECSQIYSPGESVSLAATPDPGWAFSGWTGCDSANGQECSIVMDQARLVTAGFTNSAPTISEIPDLEIGENRATGDISFLIGDIETPAAELTVTVISDNQALAPDANIYLGGSGENRIISIDPAHDQSGVAIITVTVQDAARETAMESFTLSVNDAPTIQVLSPDGGGDNADRRFTIAWSDDDADNDANISIYYDTDNSGEDGVQIAEGISENDDSNQLEWNTSLLPDGSYYIYAVIDDGVNDPASDYSDGPVAIEHYALSDNEIKLLAGDGTDQDVFGKSVSISGDYAIVGASYYEGGFGSAYIFHREGNGWVEQDMLSADDRQNGDEFGSAVSISGDYALVGALYGDSAYIFKRDGDSWSQQQKLIAQDGESGDYYGHSVSISGEYAVVGASMDDGETGSAYVFHRDGDSWSQQQKLSAADGAAVDRFGRSVSISGSYAIVGANLHDTNPNDSAGAAYIFERNGASWIQRQKLTAVDGQPGDEFGISVSISGDCAIIGNNAWEGSVYVYQRDGNVWEYQQKLTADDGVAGKRFGLLTSIDGDVVIIGASGDSENGTDSGSAYIFKRIGGVWNQLVKLTAGDAAGYDYFGSAVSISGDHAIVGAQGNDDYGSWSGSAYIYTVTNVPPTIQITEPDGDNDTTDQSYTITWMDDDFDDDASILLYYDTDNSGQDGDLINFDPISEDNTANSYTWNTSGVTEGDYYIYAIISDGANDPVIDYGAGPLTIWRNDPPVAVDDAPSIDEDTPSMIDVLANDSDADGDDLTILSITQASHGSVINNIDHVTYTPAADFNGIDTFNYTVGDGNGETATATVTVTVNAVDDPPVANSFLQDVTVEEDAGNTAIDLSSLFTDSDNDDAGIEKSVKSNSKPSLVVASIIGATLTLDYQENAHGTASIVIRGVSNGKEIDTGFTVTVNPVNDAPDALDDVAGANEDAEVNITVLANDSDIDGDALAIEAVTQGANGVVVIDGGAIVYTPRPDFFGNDSFTYTINDGAGGSDTARVSVVVNPINDNPVANDDSIGIEEDQSVTLNVLANDSDPDIEDTLTVASTTQGSNGAVVTDGSYIAYTPNSNYFGSDSFTYTVSDGKGGTDAALVRISIRSVNDNPVAAADYYTVVAGETLSIDSPGVLANDADIDRDFLTASLQEEASNGTLTLYTDGAFTYSHGGGDATSDAFTYQAYDGELYGNLCTVFITITALRDSDGDGIPDIVESASSCLNADNPDTDGDGISDGVEDANQNGAADPAETDPCEWDTDGDGYSDYEEINSGSHPLNPASTPFIVCVDPDGFCDACIENYGCYSSIQECIDSAIIEAGKTTLIRTEAGVYNENVTVEGPVLLLIEEGPVILNGP